jgi:glyoxylase-like metal-dependent hydrolase (beta-lactamase superfamily II)
MVNIEKVREDIYLIEQPTRENWFCSVTVIVGESSVSLVDTGYENTPEDYILPFLREIGRKPEQVKTVVNTHRDGDHVLGNRIIKEKTPARIAIHELEFDAVEDVDDKLQDGDVVELGDRAFTVIHTPGHRPGNICLYDKENRILLTGDTVCGDREDLIRMDRQTYIASLRKLSKLPIDTMVMAHPFQPAGKAVLSPEEAKRMIEDSIGIAEAI